MHSQVNREEAEMTDRPAPVTFKKLKTTKSDTSGVGKVFNNLMQAWHHKSNFEDRG